MKRILAIALTICMLALMGGCTKKEEKEEKAVPTAQVAYAAYQYEAGYQLSEGWMYDMTITSDDQLRTLNHLVDGLKMTIHDELFEHGRGYRLTFMDAAGSVTREILILEDGSVSRDGMMYDAEGTDELLSWLNALRIEEQDIE